MLDATAKAVGNSPDPSTSTTNQAERVTTTQQTMPLTEFTKFPELDKGLRLVIWQFACNQSRLIELEFDKHSSNEPPTFLDTDTEEEPTTLYTGTHLSSNSRFQTPALFYVSREAHNEAKMVYKLVRFNSQIHQGGEAISILPSNSMAPRHDLEGVRDGKYMWFNLLSDIIYFGSKSCFGTFRSIAGSSLPIQRVAIDAKKHLTPCCEKPLSCCMQEHVNTGHNEGFLHRLRILHGIAPKEGEEKLFPGCPALKEVFLFMTEEGPFDHKYREANRFTDRIEGFVGFEKYTAARPHFPKVSGSWLTMDAYTSHLLSTILAPLPALDIVWKGRKTPSFQLARRLQPLPSGKEFQILALYFPSAGVHRMVWWQVFQNIRVSEGDEFNCTYFPTVYCGPGVYFFKFMGTVDEIANLMAIAFKEIPNAEALYKQKITIVDPDKAVFPAKIGVAHP
ncbi:hypothetical protein NA56DRAFT_650224 [Hyaloscypha hepaticicola]|uniref:2EXR domain-containing protein n=1 Tax=Hyaloscypha hepaticicola TaxID=2082293 RepID=A0A2J6PMN5_9HELO|nr:hypothetical protein NA56DRAFT_650224 [Hyaloscypha hepaticicola]